ncbi:MAG: penicillin-binding protein activator [Pseudomonadota bacterium]
MYRLSIRPLFSLLAALACVAGCASPNTASRPTQTPQAPQPSVQVPAFDPQGTVTFALLAPLSTPRERAAQLAQALVNSARLGMADLNDRRLELKVYDTAGVPATAAQMADRALAEGADIVLGPLFSGATKSVASRVGPRGVKVLSFSTDTSAAGGPVWVTGFLPEMEAARILSFAARQGFDQVGVLYPATPAGQAALRGSREASQRGLTQVIGEASFQPGFQGVQEGTAIFADTAIGANSVLVATAGRDLQAAGSFLDFYNFNPRRVKFLGLGQWYSPSTLREQTLQGGWFPAPDQAKSDAFSARYAQRFGSKPPLVAVLGYDAVQVAGQLVQAARQAGASDLFDTALLTRSSGFEGGLGRIRFTPDGRSERALAILEVVSGNFATVDPAPFSFPPGS